jgi:hypothetical protein
MKHLVDPEKEIKLPWYRLANIIKLILIITIIILVIQLINIISGNEGFKFLNAIGL